MGAYSLGKSNNFRPCPKSSNFSNFEISDLQNEHFEGFEKLNSFGESSKCSLFVQKKSKIDFRPKKKLRKFSINYIDVKFPEESIFRISRVIEAVCGSQIRLWSQKHVFPPKHAFFAYFSNFNPRFEEVILVGNFFNLDFRVCGRRNTLEKWS